MTIKSELITILRDAVKMCAPDIHFTLAENGDDVLIQHRAGNIMLPHSHLSSERYKQMIDYIMTHTVFESYPESYPKSGARCGVLKIFEPEIIFVCHVSTLIVSHNKFKSLCLRIKNPPVPKCQKNIKMQAEVQI